MFKRLSYIFAAQFTGFVFILLLTAGGVYFVSDYYNQQSLTNQQLLKEANRIATHLNSQEGDLSDTPLSQRELAFVRICNPDQSIRYQGAFFLSSTVPLTFPQGDIQYSTTEVDEAPYRILTTTVRHDGREIGYLQVAQPEENTFASVRHQAENYLLVSIAISILTFILGLSLARRNLDPVKESMERLEQFTQDASHELKTPLSVLGSSLDVALKTERYKEGLLSAKDDLKRASELIDRLLELARLDRFNLKQVTVDLDQVVKGIGEKYQSLAAQHNLTLAIEAPRPVQVRGDEALINQAIVNLVTNALKFTPAGGTITLRLLRNHLEVEDTGVGIPIQEQVKIFDRFYQADPSRSNQGFGLGLAFVQKVIQLHNWHIKVQSTPGKGSVFSVLFIPLRTASKPHSIDS